MFLSRIDFQDKNQRMSEKNMEMIWSGSDTLGKVLVWQLNYTVSSMFIFYTETNFYW